MDTSLPTYHQAAESIRQSAQEDFFGMDSPESEPPDGWAEDTVDGSSFVIYHAQAYSIWLSSSQPSRFEEEMLAVVDVQTSIDDRIAICVSLSLAAVYRDEWLSCWRGVIETETDDHDMPF